MFMKSAAAIVRSGLAPSGHSGCGLEHFRGLAPSLLGPQIAVIFLVFTPRHFAEDAGVVSLLLSRLPQAGSR
jgi:hypothetical protein